MKIAALIITVFLVGCSSTPRVESPAPAVKTVAIPSDDLELIIEALATPVVPTAITAEPVVEQPTVIEVQTPKTRYQKIAKVLTKVVGSAMSVADAASLSSDTKMEVRDSAGAVIGQKEEHHASFLDSLTKLIAILTSTLGVYVGWKKLRAPAEVA